MDNTDPSWTAYHVGCISFNVEALEALNSWGGGFTRKEGLLREEADPRKAAIRVLLAKDFGDSKAH